jgi:hypothetical protein
MDGGSHNVSLGIATGRRDELRDGERALMVSVCARCHTPAFSRRSLDDADRIEIQSRAMLSEARAIVEELSKEKLLNPMPSERPGHPLLGHALVIGPNMVYEDISSAETKFFRMMMFHYMSAFKGAFHQNPDYTHWFGNAPLKLTLAELRSEAELLREVGTLKKRLDNLSPSLTEGKTGDLRDRLRLLYERRLKGDMTEEEYRGLKRKLLDEEGF